MARDFSPQLKLDWVPSRADGVYEVEVSARDRDTGETSVSFETFEVTSRVSGETPVITPTRNELVFLYSAAPCTSGSWMSVSFLASSGFRQSTPWLACDGLTSMNFYLAGLRAETDYILQHSILDREAYLTDGPVLSLRTGALSFSPAPTSVLQRPENLSRGVLFQNRIFEWSVATDPEGYVIWYYPENVPYLTRPQSGGYLFALIENYASGDEMQFLRQIDLAGNIELETNAARINEQLEAIGMRPMTSFHHEARRLPNGKILVLAANERLLTDVQGPGDVVVLGDMILVLDSELQLEWAWDAFDHLDVRRKAILEQKCTLGGGGCPVFRLAEVANDWVHGNSLALTPDGNILYSARHQDWIIKIHYADGRGSGEVMWRLGKDGDFRVISDDPSPWFSHQHDASIIEAGVVNKLLVFDNGNTRFVTDESVHSRGQVFEVDERARTAKLVLNIDLGAYALALGSAEKLENGNLHFDLGWMPNGRSQSLEYDPSGALVTRIEAGTQQYRSHRMSDLYTP